MIKKTICVLIFLTPLIFPQNITQEEKNKIMSNLDSLRYSIRLEAIINVVKYGITEALPNLEEKIFSQEKDIALWYLRAISAFNSSNANNIAHRFIDTIDYLPDPVHLKSTSSTNHLKVEATQFLFQREDYSTADIVFNYIEENKPGIATSSFNLLLEILNNVPEYELPAKNELMRIMLNSNEDYYSSIAIIYLTDKYGQELIPDLLNVLGGVTSNTTKNIAFEELEKLNYPEMEDLTKIQFLQDSTRSWMMLNKLLTDYNSPANYKFILDNYRTSLTIDQIAKYNLLFESEIAIPAKDFNFVFDYLEYVYSLCDTLPFYTWLGDLQFKNLLQNVLQSAKTILQNGDSLTCAVQVKSFQDEVDFVYKDSLNADPRFVTLEGWKFLYWNAQYILDRLPEPSANPNLLVNLTNSQGTQIPASNVKYYDTSWKDAVNNGDGTFTVITDRQTVSIRMFYEYANQTVHNVTAHNNTYTFHTVNTAVELQNSSGNLIDVGTVQYYAEAWRSFGTTINGIANKELLPINYSFRMTYEYGSIDKQQDISVNPTVVFQTVNAAVELRTSTGSLIDQGTVQYYAGAWRTFGTTQNGVTHKELLPINYNFRMTYEFVPVDKQQNLSTNSTVTFSTVLCTVKVSNTNNQQLEGADTKYYSGAWRDIGFTNANGEITKELLPKNLNFRAISGSISQDKQQDIGVNSLVELQLNVP